jgi:hypothetical protein
LRSDDVRKGGRETRVEEEWRESVAAQVPSDVAMARHQLRRTAAGREGCREIEVQADLDPSFASDSGGSF